MKKLFLGSHRNTFYKQEAIAAESFFESTPMCIEKGNLQTAFAESDHVLEGEMRLGGQVRLT